MAYIKIDLPPGCVDRPDISEILKSQRNLQTAEKAKSEYIDLLKTELRFAQEDPNMCKLVYEKNKTIRISSYTTFGADLIKIYPESNLLKLIYENYKRYYTVNQKRAILQYYVLKEMSQVYSEKKQTKKASPKGFSQTQCSHPPSSSHSTQHSRSDSHQAMTTTGQPVVSVDQPMEYRGQTYYPESMYKELIQHKKTQEEDIYRLQRELKEKKEEVDELRSRLSSFASKQLTEGNPDFTDLSDINRPVKMAERFHKIYDDEWTTSLESLTHATKGSICLTEEEAISLLMDIIKSSYEFCTNYAEKQTKDMVTLWRQTVDNPFASVYNIDAALSSGTSPTPPKVLVDEFKQYRKSFYKECIKNAIKNFKENVITKNPKFKSKMLPTVDDYVDVCVEVLWLMSIQVPPMAIEWPEPNSPFDSEKYKEYCKKGKTVKLAVWPAVFLNDKGPLMNKGYAMPL